MQEFPETVRGYILGHMERKLSAAYLYISDEGILESFSGPLTNYGIDDPAAGEPPGEWGVLFEGLLPLEEPHLLLPRIQTETGRYADVHLYREPGRTCVIFLDCTTDSLSRQLMQQRGNELSLLRSVHSRILDQYLGKKVASDLAKGMLRFKEEGERRVITVLFADVRGSTSFCDKAPPEVVFRTLNMYLRAMIQAILAEAGMVDKLIGDGAMAIFGLLPTVASGPSLAVRAAVQMLEDVAEINRERIVDGRQALEVGIGIATGSVSIGILGTKERRAFSAIGHHANLAARLEGQAGPSEILIDENSFKDLGDSPVAFEPKEVVLKGIDRPEKIFSYKRGTK